MVTSRRHVRVPDPLGTSVGSSAFDWKPSMSVSQAGNANVTVPHCCPVALAKFPAKPPFT